MAIVGITRPVSFDVYIAVGLTRSITFDVGAASAPVMDYSSDCSVFQNVAVDFFVEGNSRITWSFVPGFSPVRPATYQLQVGNTGHPEASDWQNVGSEITDAAALIDPTKRAFGNQLVTHYRVTVTDALDHIFTSPPAVVLGGLSFRDWTKARTIIRKEKLRLRVAAGARGFLLKRKRTGEKCPVCLTEISADVTDASCTICYGTGFAGGYFYAMPQQFAELQPGSYREARMEGPDAMTGHYATKGRILGSPQLSPGDVWVNADNDLRYWVEEITTIAQIRSLPIVCDVTMHQFNLHNSIYKFPLGGT